MSIKNFNLLKDTMIIVFIITIFFLVSFVFYIERDKNNKIRLAKNNFYLIKNEIASDILKCKDHSQIWIFGGSCADSPISENIIRYFNLEKKLKNPYNKGSAIGDIPGSVHIVIDKKRIMISIDFDASGNVDIKHVILLQ